jgi:hypothetical protein
VRPSVEWASRRATNLERLSERASEDKQLFLQAADYLRALGMLLRRLGDDAGAEHVDGLAVRLECKAAAVPSTTYER